MSDDIIKVEPVDSSKKNSNKIESTSAESTIRLDQASTQCYWNDSEFPEGSKVCEISVTYECQMGQWIKKKDPC